MRVILVLLSLLICNGLNAQSPVFKAEPINKNILRIGTIDVEDQLNKEISEYQLFRLTPEPIFEHVKDTEVSRFSLVLGEKLSWEFNLEINDLKKGRDFKTMVQKKDGVILLPQRKSSTYKGTISGKPESSVRLSIRNDHISGLISVDGESYFIEPVSRYDDQPSDYDDLFIIYNLRDLKEDKATQCGVNETTPQGRMFQKNYLKASTSECQRAKIVIAADSAMVKKLGSAENVEDEILDVFNVVEDRFLHPEINIAYEIRSLYIVEANDPWYQQGNSSFNNYLSSFRSWGNAGGFQTMDYAVASIWTGLNFDGNVVGLAWLNAVCGTLKYNANQHFTNNKTRLIQLHAHELGHNWGAGHTASANNTYIMSPSIGNLNDQWHTASIESIAGFKATRTCLSDDCTQTTNIIVAASIQNVANCPEDADGAIELTVSGGQAPYNFLWSNGATTKDIYDLTGGEYEVVISDASGDTLTISYFIIAPNPINIWGSVEYACEEANLATSVSVFVNPGGNDAYDFLWDAGGISPVIENVASGAYGLTVTRKSDGCEKSETITVENYTPLSLSFTDLIHANCDYEPCDWRDHNNPGGGEGQGGSCFIGSGAVRAEYTGGLEDKNMTYFWWSDPFFLQDSILTGLIPGIYKAQVYSWNCMATNSAEILETPVYSYEAAEICEGESYQLGTQVLTTSGIYMEAFPLTVTCDSLVELSLTVHPVFNESKEVGICEGATYFFGGQNLNEAGIYTHIFNSISGCDSTVVVDLQINPTFNETATVSICPGEQYSYGSQILTEPGAYVHTFSSTAGCDSTVNLQLNMIHIDNSITINNNILSAGLDGATSYQWVDCDNNFLAIQGETNQSLIPITSGSYAVEVTAEGCTVISDCISILILGIDGQNVQAEIYPNPTSGIITIKQPDPQLPYIIVDATGKIIASGNLKTTDHIDLSSFKSGIYYLRLSGETVKIMKH